MTHVLNTTPVWQCVFTCWGTKYTTSLIANLIQKIAAQNSQVAQFVVVTDIRKPELEQLSFMTQAGQTRAIDVVHVQMPAYFDQTIFRTSGCHAKLSMFDRGVLPSDLPAIYIDLDTVICGDVSLALAYLDTPKTVAIFQSALLPLGAWGRFAAKISRKKYYARGNSSIVVFQPSECYYIADEFKRIFAQYPQFEFKPLRADERFISWIAQDTIRAIPKSFAVKFPTEFMFPYPSWLKVRAQLPWVVKRRAGLTAITLNGLDIKPEKLLALRDGEVITDDKNRYLVWSDKLMGVSKQRIIEFYSTM
jgi:hypothetical protein